MPRVPPDQISRGGKSQNHALDLRQPEAVQTASAALSVHQRQGDRGSGDDPDADPADDKFLSAAQVRARYGGVSDMWLSRRLRDDSGFPSPMVIEGRRFWKLSDLVAWERACV